MVKKICATLVLMALASPAWVDGDAVAGKAVFRKCAICRSPSQGQNRVGPSLYAVYDRPAGIVPRYSYSDAMKNSGKVWNPATLDTYLTNPRTLVPGTKISFAGLPNAADRVNVIAHLATLK